MMRYQRIEVNGILWDVDLQEVIDMHIHAGAWERQTQECLARYLRPGMTAFDIGANVGALTLPMAVQVGQKGKVYAFEPMAWALNKLAQNCALNPRLNVEIVACALGDREAYNISCNYRSSWVCNTNGRQDGPCVTGMITLDEWVRPRGDLHLGVIKMDVDGGEYHILKGGEQLIRACKPVIVTEAVANHFAEEQTDPFRLLLAWGYRLCDLSGAAFTYEEVRRQLPAHDPEMTVSVNILALP